MTPKNNEIIIRSPHNVELDFKAAGLGERIIAYILDYVVIVIYFIAAGLLYPAEFISDIFGYDIGSILQFSVYAVPFFFYDLIFEYLMNGQTPGKKLMKIRVITLDGDKPALHHFAIRWAFRPIENGFLGFGMVPILSYLITSNNQRIGDLAANTAVIKIDKNQLFSHNILFDGHKEYKPAFIDTAWVERDDIDLIYYCLHKVYTRQSIKETAIVRQLAASLKERYDINPVNDPDLNSLTDTMLLQRFARDYAYNQTHDHQNPVSVKAQRAKRSTKYRLSSISEAD
jgi:uncharacterized RDD family membrane protein YckC